MRGEQTCSFRQSGAVAVAVSSDDGTCSLFGAREQLLFYCKPWGVNVFIDKFIYPNVTTMTKITDEIYELKN